MQILAERRRTSAGTISPADIRTMSPGTSSSKGNSFLLPSRKAVVEVLPIALSYSAATERTPEDMGMAQATDQPPPGPLALEGPPQPGELRKGTVYAPGEVVDVSPTAVVDPSPVLNATDLDSAIAGALGIVQAPTEAAKARAAEFARMTAKAKNETDALLANAQPKRAGTAIPEIAGYEPPPPKIGTIENPPKAWMQEGMVELPTLAGPALTPRPEPIDDPRARLAEERASLVPQRDQQRLTPKNPVSEQPQNSKLLSGATFKTRDERAK